MKMSWCMLSGSNVKKSEEKLVYIYLLYPMLNLMKKNHR